MFWGRHLVLVTAGWPGLSTVPGTGQLLSKWLHEWTVRGRQSMSRMSGKLSEQMVKSLATLKRRRRREEEALEAVLGLIHSAFKGRLWNTCLSARLLPGSWTFISVLSSSFQAWNLDHLPMLAGWAHLFPSINWEFLNLHLHSWSDVQSHINYMLTRCSCLGVPLALPTQHVQYYLHLLPSFLKINLFFIHAPHPHNWLQTPRNPILKPRVLIYLHPISHQSCWFYFMFCNSMISCTLGHQKLCLHASDQCHSP